jgi:hypothetical protein
MYRRWPTQGGFCLSGAVCKGNITEKRIWYKPESGNISDLKKDEKPIPEQKPQ